MRKFSILALVLLTSCSVLLKHKEELKPIAHEAIDEEIDNLAKKQAPQEEAKPAK